MTWKWLGAQCFRSTGISRSTIKPGGIAVKKTTIAHAAWFLSSVEISSSAARTMNPVNSDHCGGIYACTVCLSPPSSVLLSHSCYSGSSWIRRGGWFVRLRCLAESYLRSCGFPGAASVDLQLSDASGRSRYSNMPWNWRWMFRYTFGVDLAFSVILTEIDTYMM
jgi:hypothetical protein